MGETYRFSLIAPYGVFGDMIAAEGDGPPMIVVTDGCFVEPQVLTVAVDDESVHIAALTDIFVWHSTPGWEVVALLCNERTCSLYGLPAAEATGELYAIAGSELSADDWLAVFHDTRGEGDAVEDLLCVTKRDTRRCFGSAGWEPETELQVVATPAFEPPQCEGFELVLYESPYGVTPSGEVILVDSAEAAEPQCERITEPLGTPILLYDYMCGISSSPWLLTDQVLFRGIQGNGCNCNVD